ncbi:shikimate kinase [Ignatzschineria sp. LJL83]
MSEEITNIFLVGPMGSGKTTVGKLLAQELAYHFKDSDHQIEKITGVTIPYIFEMEGEEGFRDREVKMIEQLCDMEGIVLSTGGGVVLREENRIALAKNGIVIYLNVPPASLYERVRFDTQRPLLKNDNPQAVLEKLFDVRDPLYREIADYIIFSDNISPKVVVSAIIDGIIENKTPLPEWLVGNR